MDRTGIISLKLLAVLLAQPFVSVSQPSEKRLTRPEYIEKYSDLAIQEMLTYGIPASITMAQGILESGDGNSPLARYANNHFGIKCHTTWSGPSFIQDDDEKNECFRKYRNVAESYRDHSEFLRGRKWYASLFELKLNDYEGWARGLKAAGYATHPKYAELLIELIERNKLYELDKFQSTPRHEPVLTAVDKEVVSALYRKSGSHNRIKFVVATVNDNIEQIAEDHEMAPWQIRKYNDLHLNGDSIISGQRIYLQPKRSNGAVPSHVVKKGETIYSISQEHGIKIRHIIKKNHLSPGREPEPGTRLILGRPEKKQRLQ